VPGKIKEFESSESSSAVGRTTDLWKIPGIVVWNRGESESANWEFPLVRPPFWLRLVIRSPLELDQARIFLCQINKFLISRTDFFKIISLDSPESLF